MNEQEIERCLERFTMGKATDVMNFDYAGTLAYIQRLKAENAALRERLEKAVELPYSHLEMLKLLTCASICYAEIKCLITARMRKSKDIADLFMECPTVQGTILDLALYRLSESNLNCNKIKGFEEVINATGSFKDYLAKAEARLAELKELQGGEE